MTVAPAWAAALFYARANPGLEVVVEGADGIQEGRSDRRVGMLSPCAEVSPPKNAFRARRSASRARTLDGPVEWSLPGRGLERTSEACGTEYFVGCRRTDAQGHDGKAYIRRRAHRCNGPMCPMCEGTKEDDPHAWSRHEARVAARRLWWGKDKLHEGYPVHVIASPPQEAALGLMATVQGTMRLRSAAEAVILDVGYLGGLLVFHPHRCRDTEGNRLGGWWLQNGGVPIDGPHFHFVGVGWNRDTKTTFERTGWVIHRAAYYTRRPHERRVWHDGVLRQEAAARMLLEYLLQHAGIGRGTVPKLLAETPETRERFGTETWGTRARKIQAVVWFGLMSNRVLGSPEIEDAIDPCPLCGAPLERVIWLGTLPAPPDGLVDPELVEPDSMAGGGAFTGTVWWNREEMENDKGEWAHPAPPPHFDRDAGEWTL